MARNTPKVQGTSLIPGAGQEPTGRRVEVGSEQWFEWLEKNPSFTFESLDSAANFSARREQRQGSWYWYAYRRKNGKLRSAYLGRTEELNLDRLNEIAFTLDASLSPPKAAIPANSNGIYRQENVSLPGPLLATKLFLPRARPDLVARPRLLAWLNQASQRQLILISAAPGFGKTTVLAQWLGQLSASLHQQNGVTDRQSSSLSLHPSALKRVAWFSLDENDNDPARFLTYMIAALQTLQPGLGESALWLLQTPKPTAIEIVLAELVNSLSTFSSGDFGLVLDDYHLITSEAVHKAITFLLDYLPPNMHLIITSRVDPPLPLARLRARGQLAELRAAELRFTPEEVTALLNRSVGLNLSRDEVAALEEQTEGWAAGLQLAALSIQASSDANSFIRAFSGSHRFVLDYLAEEVLRRQPENVQTFLLQTSILERLSGPLCDAVTGRNDSQQMLEKLEQANLFLVPLDEKRGWFRYHHIFAEFLRTRNNGDLTGLHRQASQWLEEQGQIDEAIKHALVSIDYERAARLIEQVAQAMLMRGELTTLSRWLDSLPGEIMHLRPKLYIFKAWSQVINGQLSDAEQGLVEAERTLGTVGSEASQIAAIRSLVAAFHIDIPRLLELSGQAVKAMAEDNLFVRSVVAWSRAFPAMLNGETEAAIRAFSEAEKVARKAGNLLICVSSLCQMAELNISKGQLREAARMYREAIQFAQEYNPQQPRAATGMAYMGLSMVLIEWNELDEATRYANEGIEASKEWGELITVDGYVSLVRLKNIQNDLEGAMECLKKIEQLARQLDNPPIDDMITAHQARIWLRHGLLDKAIEWADKVNFDPSVFFLHTWITPTTLVRIRMAQGHLSEAERYLGYLRRRVESGQLNGHLIEVLTLESLVLQARGKTSEALARLEQTFTLAEPEGYIRIFVDEGRPMANLLKSFLQSAPHRTSGKLQRYAGKLLAAIEAPSELSPTLASQAGTGDSSSPLLSERELKVLRLVGANLSNQAIARELMVEVSTIKTHLLHIYNKLQVHTRREAVEQARQLKLL